MSADWSGRRVLVTGASGFIGSHLVSALARGGAQVVGLVPGRLDRLSLESRGLAGHMDVWMGSARDAGLLDHILSKYDIDACFHLAATSQVRSAAEAPVDAFENNVQGTWTVLEACRRRKGFRSLLLTSSDKVYGDQGERACDERTPLAASSTYDVSKACADLLVRSYAHQYGLPTVVVRFGNVYGPGDYNLERLVPNSARRLASGGRPIIHGGIGDFRRELLYVTDAVAACLLLAARVGELCGEAFNIGTGETHRVCDVVDELIRIAGARVEPEIGAHRDLKELPYQRLDVSKVQRHGWRPTTTLDDGLRASWDWYRQWVTTGKPPPL